MKGKSPPPEGGEESVNCTINHASDLTPTRSNSRDRHDTSRSAVDPPSSSFSSSSLATAEMRLMKSDTATGIGMDGSQVLGEFARGEKDPPVVEYSSEGSSSASSGPRLERSVDFAAEDDDRSGSRSSGTGSTASHQGLSLSFRSSDEKGTSPVASTPLRGKSSSLPVEDGDRLAAPFSEGGSDLNPSTPASAKSSPMGPHVRRILEALASFEGSPDQAACPTFSLDDVAVPDSSEIVRRPGGVKNTSRSVSGGSEASSSKNHSRKKKPRTEYSAPPFSDKEEDLNVEMLDISAIISQVDRKNLDDELDQLVRELDEAVGRETDASRKGIRLRRRSLRRRGRKGRAAARGKRRNAGASPSNDPPLSEDNSASLDDDEDDDNQEESQSSDPRARAFMNMVAAEDWMANEAYSSEDSVIEDSSCVTTQTEEHVQESVEGPPAADAANESPAIQALRDAWRSFTLTHLFDVRGGGDKENRTAESKIGAVEASGKEQPKNNPEEPRFLEFIDPAFFEELWKALLSIKLQNCRPLDVFQTQAPEGDTTLSTKESNGECSASSTIPTDAASFDVCDSLSICSGTVPPEAIDHSAILAKCLARGGTDGDDAGVAGSSPLAKRKAALLLQQCEKKFPSLYKRIIARLESKAGVSGSDVGVANSHELGTPQPSPIDSDEDDSLFSAARANTSTTAELANKTPRVRNSRRDISAVELSASESREVDPEDALAFESQEANSLNSSPDHGSAPMQPFRAAITKGQGERANPSSTLGTDPSKLLMENEFTDNEIEDSEEVQDFDVTSPTDARDYSLLTSFDASAVDNESPTRARSDRLVRTAPSLEDLDHLAQGVVSPLTMDSHEFQECTTLGVENRGEVQPEQGAEVTDILADLTMPTDGEGGGSVIRVKDLRESLHKKVPTLTPKSSDTRRPRRVRHSSVPRGVYSDSLSDAAYEVRDQFPVVLKHRVLSHVTAETRKGTWSRLKPRKLEGFLDRSTTPKSRDSTSRSLPYSPDERRSPTSFPSLFVKGSLGVSGTKEGSLRGPEINRDYCPEEAQSVLLPASLSRAFTLPTPSRSSWSKLETSPRNAFNDSRSEAGEDLPSQTNESVQSPVGVHDFDGSNSQWVAFPTPPRGTFRADLEGDNVPILPSPSQHPSDTAPLKGTGQPSMTVRRAAAGRSKSSGRAAPRESALRMLAARPPSEAPRARFRRLVSPVAEGKPVIDL